MARPHVLLADSRLLFSRGGSPSLLRSICAGVEGHHEVAYIGASSGDSADAYAVFEAAMDAAGFRNRRMLRSPYAAEDRAFLMRANLIVLGGGDVQRGWNVLRRTGMHHEIIRRHAHGATLIGISAGAVQLGRYAVVEIRDSYCELQSALNLVPLMIDVHDEHRSWKRLSSTVGLLEGAVSGVGIPRGGGMLFHGDGTLEVIRGPLNEFSFVGNRVRSSLLVSRQG